ncbi:MAG: GAF domain-containing protein [Rubrivivax sp.]|nr:GAF domain-containing protein [Pyrinomonadaceae bacterium]
MSTGDLEKSLRDDIESHIGGRLGGLEEEVERLQSQINESLTRLRERMKDAAGGDASLAVAVSDHLRNARNHGIEAAASESSRASASADIALIKAAVEDLDEQHSQSDILSALVNRCAAFAPRIAFFVVRNNRATGWRARGLAGTVGDDTVREISLPVEADTLLGEVVRARSTWSGGPGAHAEDHSIYSHFGDDPPQRMVAVPLMARGKAVAVLYADSAGQDADAVNLEALETLVRVAGMAVELSTSRRAPKAETRDDAAAQEAPPQEASAPEASAPEVSTALSPSEQPQPEEHLEPQPAAFEPQPFAEAAPQPAPEFEPEREAEPSPSFTPQAEQSPSSFAPAESEAAPPADAHDVSPLGARRRSGAMDMDFPVEVAEEDKRFHNEARRFARLLVSEIKLYNEQKVREGRDAGDLYNRLRDDIDRSRQMYDKRVRPEVAGRYDYFHNELVSALAEGDAGRLGEGYPGENA